MRLIAVLLLAILVACSPTHTPSGWKGWNTEYTHHDQAPEINGLTIPTVIDVAFNSETRGMVQDAVSDWNHVLNGRYRFVIQDHDNFKEDAFILRIIYVNDRNAPETGVLGWFQSDEPQNVYIVQGALNTTLLMVKTVTLHEIGHWFGLPHFKPRGTLLYPYVNEQPPCVDITIAAALSLTRGWPMKYLNWCTP